MESFINMVLIPIYAFSSHLGFALFFYIWVITRIDRIAIHKESAKPDSKMGRKERAIGWRNELVAGILALAFLMYAIATDLVLIRLALDIGTDSWYRLGTVILLVLGNLLEMSVAFALLYSRKEIRGKDSILNPIRVFRTVCRWLKLKS